MPRTFKIVYDLINYRYKKQGLKLEPWETSDYAAWNIKEYILVFVSCFSDFFFTIVLSLEESVSDFYIFLSEWMNVLFFYILGQNIIYGCVIRRKHYLKRKDGGEYDAQEYDKYPERYISVFNKKVSIFFKISLFSYQHFIFFSRLPHMPRSLLMVSIGLQRILGY